MSPPRRAIGFRFRSAVQAAVLGLAALMLPVLGGPAAAPQPPASTRDQQKRLEERDRLNDEVKRLREKGRLLEAIAVAEIMLALERGLFGEIHDEVAGSLEQIAEMHEENGTFAAARTARRRILEIQTKLAGASHWRVTDARLALAHLERLAALDDEQRQQLREAARLSREAVALGNQKKYAEALPPAQRAVNLYRELLGEKDRALWTSLENLAWLYSSQRDGARAETLLRQAGALRKQEQGAAHPDYANNRNDLGWVYRDLRNEVQAERCFREALDLYRQTHGEEDARYLNTLINLALLYEDEKAYTRAEPLYQKTLAVRKKVLGTKHPDYADSLHRLGGLYRSMNELAKAEPLLRQALAIRREVEGAAHPRTLASLDELLETLESLGKKHLQGDDVAAARAVYRELVVLREQRSGAGHWRLADARLAAAHAERVASLAVPQRRRLGEADRLHAQAEELGNKQNHRGAIPLVRQALEIRQQLLGEADADSLASLQLLGRCYRDLSDYDRAGPLLSQNVQLRKEVLGAKHPDYALSLNILGWLHYYRDDQAQAEQCFRAAREVHEAVGEKHADYAITLTNLAVIYRERGDYDQAEPLFLQSLEIQRAVLGDRHSDYASSLNNLGWLYRYQKKWAPAERCFQEALAIYRQIDRGENVDYATTLKNLGQLHQAMGAPRKAEPLFRQSLGICRKVLGEDHPDTISALNRLAHLYYNQSDYAHAEPLYRQVLDLRRRTLPEKHPDIAASRSNLANLLSWRAEQDLDREEFAAARKARQEEIDLRSRVDGPTHWRVTDARLGLAHAERLAGMDAEQRRLVREARDWSGRAEALGNQGKYREAIPLARQALALRKQVLGEDDPDYAVSLSNLGWYLRDSDAYAEAEPFLRQALELRQRLLGKGHPSSGLSANNLGWLYRYQGKPRQAEALFRQALDVYRTALGEEHNTYATTLTNLGELYTDLGAYERAEPLFRQALTIRKKVLYPDDLDYARSLHNLGWVHRELGDYGEAEPLLLQASAIRRRVLGETAPVYGNSLNTLGWLYAYRGQDQRAETAFRQAGEVYKKAYGENNLLYAQSLNNLGYVYRKQGNLDKAEPLFRQVLAIRKQIQGETHPDYAAILNNLGWVFMGRKEPAQAEALFRQAAEIYRQAQGNAGSGQATSFNNVASALEKLAEAALDRGDFAAARKALAEVAALRARPDRPWQAVTARLNLEDVAQLETLAAGPRGQLTEARKLLERVRALQMPEQASEALPLAEKAVAIRQAILGKEHHLCGDAWFWVGFLHFHGKAYGKAEAALKQVVACRHRTLGNPHPDYAAALNSLGVVYTHLKDYPRAQRIFHEALTIRKQTLGPRHVQTAETLHNLGQIYAYRGDFAQARELLQQALAQRKRLLGDRHADYAQTLLSLAAVHDRQGDRLQAEGLRRQAAALTKAPGANLDNLGAADLTEQMATSADRKPSHFVLQTGHTCPIASVAVSPNGKWVATAGTTDATVVLWDAETGKEIHRLSDEAWWYRDACALAFSSDGQHVWTGVRRSDGFRGELWQTETGIRLRGYKGVTGSSRATACWADGPRLLLAGADHVVRLWDPETDRELQVFRGHSSSVTILFVSPDGKRVLTGSSDRTVRLWDAQSGKELRVFGEHPGAISAVALSPDGQRVLVGVVRGSDSRAAQTLRMWDVATGTDKTPFRTDFSQDVLALAFAPDGKRVLVAGSDGTVRLWDAGTGQELQVFQGHARAVRCVAFTPDGKRLLTGSEDRTARLWDAQSGKELRRFEPYSHGVEFTTFSPDGTRILTGRQDNSVQLLDLGHCRELQRFEHPALVRAGIFAPDGNHVLTGSEDGLARLWDTHTGRQVRAFRHEFPRSSYVDIHVAFAPDGRRVLTGNSDAVRLWDARSGEELLSLPARRGQVSAAVFAPDGRRVLACSAGGEAGVWDSGTGEELHYFGGHGGPVHSIAVSADGKRAVTGGADGTVRLWDAETGKELRRLELHPGGIQELAVGVDGKRLLIAGEDGTVRAWDLETGTPRETFRGHTRQVTCLALSRDGRRLLTGSADHTVRLWDVASARALWTFRGHAHDVVAVGFVPDRGRVLSIDSEGKAWVCDAATGADLTRFDLPNRTGLVSVAPDGQAILVGLGNGSRLLDAGTGKELRALGGRPASLAVTAVGFSADGRHILHGDAAGALGLWERETGKLLWTVRAHTAGVGVLGSSADGRHILTGSSDGTARLWETATGKEVQSFVGHTQGLTAGAFGFDGRQVFTGSRDGSVRLWDVETGEELRQFFGHGGSIRAALSSDGQRILTGASDGSVRLWDAGTGRELRWLRGRAAPVTCVGFSPDGTRVAAGSADTTLRLWDVETGQERAVLTHPGSVRALAFSADGRRLFCGCAASGSEWKGTATLWDLATGKKLQLVSQDYGSTAAVAISPDGRHLLTGTGHYSSVRLWESATGKEVLNLNAEGECLAFSPDGKQILAGHDRELKVFDAAIGKELKKLGGSYLTAVAFSPDGAQVLTEADDHTVLVWDARTGARLQSWQTPTGLWSVRSYVYSPDRTFLAARDEHNEQVVILSRLPSATEICKVINARNATLVVTPDHYYAASRDALHRVAWRVGDRALPFAQFDLRYNRPDIVLERIGLASKEVIDAYRNAYRKRLRRMGFKEEMLGDDLHLPEVTVTANARFATRAKVLKLKVQANDARYLLDRLHVYVNGVPIGSSNGLSLRGKAVQRWEQEIEVELGSGKNRIEVSVLNEKGAESLAETLEVRCDVPAAKRNLFVVAVGVSQYREHRYNLTFADKDARDVAAYFEGRRADFERVTIVPLLNQEATREKILATREVLKQSKVDDLVVVFLAGHGLLDARLDYYFATTDVDFRAPAGRGLSYDAIEGLLDGIPARRKLLLMDTCHAGELDKEEVEPAASAPPSDGVVTRRGIRDLEWLHDRKLGRQNAYRLVQELFVDLRRGTGAVVIASAGGAEYALESDAWRNGVFTRSVLEGLTTKTADRNKDGRVQVSELRDYVLDQVRRLTHGRQVPTARRENLEFDFSLD